MSLVTAYEACLRELEWAYEGFMGDESSSSRLLLIKTVGILVLGYVVQKVVRRPSNFPPGPRGPPLVGYAPSLAFKDFNNPAKAFQAVADEWGPVAGFWLGSMPTVLVSSYTTVREVLSDDKMAGRLQSEVFKVHSPTNKIEGLFSWYGPEWLKQRRFFLRHLRDLGFGKSRAEQLIQEEIEECLNYLEETARKSEKREVVVDRQVAVSSVNVLWAVVAGKRHRRDDEKFAKLLAGVDDSFRASGAVVALLIAFPQLRHIIPDFSGWTAYKTGIENLREFVQETIKEHRLAASGEGKDLIDLYLEEMAQREQQVDREPDGFSESQLVTSILDLMSAGTETTASSVGFVLLSMLHHPEAQKKVQDELDAVVGRDRLPCISDKVSLPYTEAVILEVQRMCGIAPLTVPHMATDDTKIQGYSIPKGTVVHCNLTAIHMDKDYWGDPETFRPERFISKEGKIHRTEHLMPFGYGRRSCMGEPLARMALFLFSAAILQKYRLLPSPDFPPPAADDVLPGITISCKPFHVILQRR